MPQWIVVGEFVELEIGGDDHESRLKLVANFELAFDGR